MKRDPEKVVDATRETKVDWSREVQSGNLIPVTGMTRDTSHPLHEHVQGKPLTEKEMGERVIPGHVSKHIAETRRMPEPNSGKGYFGAPPGGWPNFKKSDSEDSPRS